LTYGGKKRADVDARFEVVYHLYSTSKGGAFVSLRVRTPEDNTIPSAVPIFPGANLQEREVYDLFGIKFRNHPDMRRIFLNNDFPGHPLCKDFEDPKRVVKRPY
jgi:NADH:ubiquinone oxidoreductase subunit C